MGDGQRHHFTDLPYQLPIRCLSGYWRKGIRKETDSDYAGRPRTQWAQQTKLGDVQVFVASPSDVAAERDALSHVIDGLRDGLAKRLGLTLTLQRWEAVPPDIGRPQEVLMRYFADEPFDIFVGILWTRFGSPRRSYSGRERDSLSSGTHEEFMHALRARKHGGAWPLIAVYQCTRGPKDWRTLDLVQAGLVKDFFKEFEAGGKHPGIKKDYDSVDEFERRVRGELEQALWKYALANGITSIGAATSRLQRPRTGVHNSQN